MVFRPYKWVPSLILYMSQMSHEHTCKQCNLDRLNKIGMVAYLGVDCRCRYRHHILMCHKYHVKHTSKQCNLDRLKSGSKRGHQRDANLCVAYTRPTDEHDVISIWRLYLPGVEPGCSWWLFGITTATP